MLRIRDVYPGSGFFPSRIQLQKESGSRIRIYVFLSQKLFLSSRKYDHPDLAFLPIPDPGFKKALDPRIWDPDPQHCESELLFLAMPHLTPLGEVPWRCVPRPGPGVPRLPGQCGAHPSHRSTQHLPVLQRREYHPAVLRIRDVYPGSRIRLFSFPDPGSELSPSRIPDPHQRI